MKIPPVDRKQEIKSSKPSTMKKLLFAIMIIIPNAIQSQTLNPTPSVDGRPALTLQPSQVDSVYIGLEKMKILEKENARLKADLFAMNNLVQTGHDELMKAAGKIEALDKQIADANSRFTDKAVDIQKTKDRGKMFVIGPSAGINYNGKAVFGATVTFKLFSF